MMKNKMKLITISVGMATSDLRMMYKPSPEFGQSTKRNEGVSKDPKISQHALD
jgi:hypothetical protein